MNGRHELKYYINASDYAQLRARLRIVAKPDENAAADGGYIVRSLYFDDYADKAVFEKLSGLSRRKIPFALLQRRYFVYQARTKEQIEPVVL